MPTGSNNKREHEFQKLEKRFKQEHRYDGREDEVAARIVNKQRAQYGETRSAKQMDKQGKSPGRGLPINDYEHLTAAQIAAKLDGLSNAELRKIRNYEAKHKSRKGLMQKLERRLTH